MTKLVMIVALVGLVGCTTQGDGDTTTESDGTAASVVASASAGASGEASGTASAACAEAFAPLAEQEITSTSELGDLAEEVQPTIEACESVADWIAGAQDVVEEEVRPGTADLLLRIQCESPSLSNTLICEELG
ncbi:MAG TPA: hypothetical protein VJ794_08320 [Gemmatimonadales bacterium]|nr:hypothetical protein [Gemmatimonadales bacterium]